LSGECPENEGFNWAEFASLERIQSLFLNDLERNGLAPKAEVTGSNPVGCTDVSMVGKLISPHWLWPLSAAVVFLASIYWIPGAASAHLKI